MVFARFRRLEAADSAPPSAGRAATELAPFAAVALLAWLATVFGTTIDWSEYGISVAVLLGSAALGTAFVVGGHERLGTVGGSLGFLLAVGLLRDATGGSSSGVSIVSLLAVFQTALYLSRRRDLAVVLLALTGFYLIPLILIGLPHYPHSGYRSALLNVAVSSIVGFVTQSLVADIRARAAVSRHRENMLVQVNQILQHLFDSPNAREDVCKAVKEISGATAALLYEPAGASDLLSYTAGTIDEPSPDAGISAAPGSAIDDVFRSRTHLLITHDVESRIGNFTTWEASGRPSSVLYEPLVQRGTPLGVLIVGWHDVRDINDPRVVVASVLAHEGASVIARADMIHHLTDEAHTDALTNLPNRRAWNARLEMAAADNQTLAVAIMDLDHFKRFNDTYGHPAGDELLKDAADAWRAETRAGDFLARLGGEEFGVLIFDAEASAAVATVDRLRALVPGEQTCSAGVAFRTTGDNADELVNRADRALYDAKALGRARTCISGDEMSLHLQH